MDGVLESVRFTPHCGDLQDAGECEGNSAAFKAELANAQLEESGPGSGWQ